MTASSVLPSRVDVFLVGAGFGGLGAAIKLQEAGERDFLCVDRGSEVGGTWRDNSYPGAACDVPSQLYSFSFAPNPDWSHSFSRQWEIQDYLRRVARESGVLDRFRFNVTFESAAWDAETDAMADRDLGRPDHCPAAHQRRRVAVRSEDARDRRHRPVHRPDLPFLAVESRHGAGRQANRGDRHRRLRHPDRAGARRPGRPGGCLPAHRALGVATTGRGLPAVAEEAAAIQAGAAAGASRGVPGPGGHRADVHRGAGPRQARHPFGDS